MINANVIKILKRAVKAFKESVGDKEYTKHTLVFMEAAERVSISLGSYGDTQLAARLVVIREALWYLGHDDVALDLQMAI